MGDTLRDNFDMKRAIVEYEERRVKRCSLVRTNTALRIKGSSTNPLRAACTASLLDDISSVHQMGRIFAQLDGLRDMLAVTLDGWEPPQLVVIGNEKTGKSTLLERLCMMPIFPHDDNLCTRMKIQVRLRRTAQASAPRLEVIDTSTNLSVGPSRTIPMDGANIDVREAMERIIRDKNTNLSGVSADHMIVLHVESPNVPSLNLVDMPGLVSAASPGEPEDMAQQTQALVQDHIEKHKEHSLFLCVIPATSPPNSTLSMQLIQQNGLRIQSKTIRVITMCDDIVRRHHKKLRERLNQTGDAAVLQPHEYVATMNAPSEEKHETNYARLRHQAMTEPEFFCEEGLEDLLQSGHASCDHLMEHLDSMFLKYVMGDWVPDTLRRLLSEEQKLQARLCDLGSYTSVSTGFDTKACASAVCELLNLAQPWMARQQAQGLKQISLGIELRLAELTGYQVKLDEADAHMKLIRDDVTETVQSFCAAVSEQLCEWVENALKHDTFNSDFVGNWMIKKDVAFVISDEGGTLVYRDMAGHTAELARDNDATPAWEGIVRCCQTGEELEKIKLCADLALQNKVYNVRSDFNHD